MAFLYVTVELFTLITDMKIDLNGEKTDASSTGSDADVSSEGDSSEIGED